jgi:hypothetical protein
LARRWPAALPVALIVAAGGAATMVAVAASDRTSNAYSDYLERADVGDVIINPAMATQEIAEEIRGLPGVERVTMSALLTTSFDQLEPMPRPDAAVTDVIDENTTFVLGSSDGRYFDMDRPVVQSGRMPTGAGEAVITPETSAAHDLHVGDVVPMSFWGLGIPDGLVGEALEQFENEIVAPLGVEQVTIVGIVVLADEVLPEDLYPRQRMIVSPDLAAKYDCLPSEPPPGLTLAENIAILVPDECAFAQHYFSVQLAGGAAAVKPALDEFLDIINRRNQSLLEISDLGQVPGQPPQYFLIPTETQLDLERVDLAVRPTVAALLVLALVAGTIAVALAGLAVWREVQRSSGDQAQWHQLGVPTRTRAFVTALPPAVAAVVGGLVAIPIAWWFDTGPVGLVSALEPDAGRRLQARSVLGLLTVVVLVLLAAACLAVLTARRTSAAGTNSDVRQGTRGALLTHGSPVLSEGLRAAYGRRSAIPVIAGITLAMASFVAALAFGNSLSNLIATPTSYGWPWDAAAMTGGGYGDLDIDAAHQLLDDDPDVEDWTYLGFINQISLDGEPMAAVIDSGVGKRATITVLDGELPDAADEVAVGSATAEDRDLDVGDTVELGGMVTPRPAVVTGIVVLPTLGPFVSDRVSAGVGLLVTDALFDAPDLEMFREAATGWYAFVGVDLADEAHDAATVARIEQSLAGLDRYGVPALTYPTPVRPAEIIDAEDTRSLPLLFGIGFAGVAAIGLGVASWASARARRRELAVLAALGLADRQVRHTIWVQSLATMLLALAIGVPVGVVTGRALWRAFASSLGVVPDPTTSSIAVVLVVLAGVVAAVVAALIPSHLATRVSPAAGLRAE